MIFIFSHSKCFCSALVLSCYTYALDIQYPLKTAQHNTYTYIVCTINENQCACACDIINCKDISLSHLLCKRSSLPFGIGCASLIWIRTKENLYMIEICTMRNACIYSVVYMLFYGAFVDFFTHFFHCSLFLLSCASLVWPIFRTRTKCRKFVVVYDSDSFQLGPAPSFLIFLSLSLLSSCSGDQSKFREIVAIERIKRNTPLN